MPFERFLPPRKAKPPQVSIKRTGAITFDNVLAATFGLADASHAILYYDAAKKLVGVQPARGPKEEGAMKLSHRKRVSSLPRPRLLRGLRHQSRPRAHYPVRLDTKTGMAVIDLGDVTRRRGPRKRKF